MKKFTKVCLWTVLGAFILGIILIGIGVLTGGRGIFRSSIGHIKSINFDGNDWFDDDYDNDNNYDDSDNDYDDRDNDYDDDHDDDYDDDDGDAVALNSDETRNFAAEEIENLNIQIKASELNMISYNGDQVKIGFKSSSHRKKFSCNSKNGTLTVKETTDNGVWNHMGNSNVTILIPKGMEFERVKIRIDAGEVNIENTLRCDILDAVVNAGELDTERIFVRDLILETGVGSASISGIVSGDATIECGVGEISLELEDRERDHNYSVECGVGTISIGQRSYSGLSRSTEINNGTESNYVISCGVGEIDLEFE